MKYFKSVRGQSLAEFAVTTAMMATLATTAAPKFSGVGEGAICWFDTGVTDSWASNLNVIDCMGFLSGSCCPHYDSEKDRRPSVHKFIEDNKVPSVYAIEDGAAIHFIDNKPYKNISFYKGSNIYLVDKEDGKIIEQAQKMVQVN